MDTIQIDSAEYELLMKQHKRMREALEYIEKQDPFIKAEDRIEKMQDLTLKAGYALSDVINWEQEIAEVRSAPFNNPLVRRDMHILRESFDKVVKANGGALERLKGE